MIRTPGDVTEFNRVSENQKVKMIGKENKKDDLITEFTEIEGIGQVEALNSQKF